MTRDAEDVIRERRLALGLTQDEAARRAGVSRNEWNQMEKGGRGVGPRNAARFVEVLGGRAEEYLTRPMRPEIADLRDRVVELEETIAELAERVSALEAP